MSHQSSPVNNNTPSPSAHTTTENDPTLVLTNKIKICVRNLHYMQLIHKTTSDEYQIVFHCTDGKKIIPYKEREEALKDIEILKNQLICHNLSQSSSSCTF